MGSSTKKWTEIRTRLRHGRGGALIIADISGREAPIRRRAKARGGRRTGRGRPNIVSEIGDVIIRLNRAWGIPPKLEKTGPDVVDEINDAIVKLNREMGVTVLLVEQKLPFARKVANRFCIMDRGRTVAGSAMDELTEDMVKHYLTV
jgi:hypothetical protein